MKIDDKSKGASVPVDTVAPGEVVAVLDRWYLVTSARTTEHEVGLVELRDGTLVYWNEADLVRPVKRARLVIEPEAGDWAW